MEGGTQTLEELIKGTEKGILVTRLWYIREVDPQTLLFTGLTRDGTFYIENGQIKFPVKNFRFNESPVIMLNNLDALGIPERTVSGESAQSAMIPPMRIRDFTFSSLSEANIAGGTWSRGWLQGDRGLKKRTMKIIKAIASERLTCL